MALSRGEGIVDIPSNHSVDQTVKRLREILETKGSPSSRWSTTAEKRRKRD